MHFLALLLVFVEKNNQKIPRLAREKGGQSSLF
jgi:hypothetical protein